MAENNLEYKQAKEFYSEAIDEALKLGKDNLEFALCCNYLGPLYLEQGEYNNAEAILLEVLLIQEKHYVKHN